MHAYPVSHLADHVLFRECATARSQVSGATAWLLAYLGEIDARKLYLAKAWPSMFACCVHEMEMSEDTAYKRINVARKAREFPAILPAIADGRLKLNTVILLSSYLLPGNAEELLAAAAHKTRAEVELLIATRFPKPDAPTRLDLVGAAGAAADLSGSDELELSPDGQLAARRVGDNTQPTPGRIEARETPRRAKATPLAPDRYALQVTVSEATHDKLRYAQALLGHAVPTGDIAAVLDRALDALVEKLERRKFAKSVRSRPRKGSPKGRYVQAEIRRTVWQRDGGRCTFTSDAGKRCDAHDRLELDHIVPVAKGGQATASNLRLRCRAHNQFEAERAFGAGFMQAKREASRRGAADAKARRLAESVSRARAKAEAEARSAREEELMPYLRQLGYKAKEARLGAEAGAQLADASLEQRVRAALNALAPTCVRPRSAAPEAASVASPVFAAG